MRNYISHFLLITTLLLFATCSNDLNLEETKPLTPTPSPSEGTLLLTATMPDDDPTTRVDLDLKGDVNNSIAVTWNETDEIYLAYVQKEKL